MKRAFVSMHRSVTELRGVQCVECGGKDGRVEVGIRVVGWGCASGRVEVEVSGAGVCTRRWCWCGGRRLRVMVMWRLTIVAGARVAMKRRMEQSANHFL